jgi:hypothetical protein
MSNIYNNSFNIFCLGNKDEMTYTMFNADKHKDTNDNVTVLWNQTENSHIKKGCSHLIVGLKQSSFIVSKIS